MGEGWQEPRPTQTNKPPWWYDRNIARLRACTPHTLQTPTTHPMLYRMDRNPLWNVFLNMTACCVGRRGDGATRGLARGVLAV